MRLPRLGWGKKETGCVLVAHPVFLWVFGLWPFMYKR